ncbi:MAG: transcription termination/antitermination factor NusG [Planctomycetes bacterium]|nr:transcription termination/antitermination factor NusG [Planctomycetota bacterium]
MALDWYFLRVQVGREDRIRKSMIARLKQAGLEERVPQIVVPSETVAEVREGKRRIRKKKLYPGYLMVQMELDEDVWFAIRETPGFGDFVGSRSTPTPMTAEEVDNVLGRMDESKEQPKMSVQFQKGDRVKIKQGPFENIDGVVEEVHPDKGTLEVAVTIFGRSTPVSLGYWEVEAL